MKNEKGFTVIELIIFFVILVVLAVFFVIQKVDLESSFSDQQRKTAINAIYYSLTEVYQPEHGYYPATITEDTLKGIDPEQLYDSWDVLIGETDSEYRYEGLDCNGDGHCKDFKLTSELEKEDAYVLDSLGD
jgi:type II secretory pathway pseudopilin PulG